MRARGDAAVLEYTRRFDRLDAAIASPSSRSRRPSCSAALRRLPGAQRDALEAAAARIRAYHERQRRAVVELYRGRDGTELGQQVTPLDRVGLYVPGGKAAYPSSVLMNAMPAQGRRRAARSSWWCRRPAASATRWCSRRRALAGVDRVFTIGGAQAVGALAYGTATDSARSTRSSARATPTSPSAKRRVFGAVGIDMVAGPSRDPGDRRRQRPTADWVAMDLFSQAEHDELAQAILLSPDAGYLDAVAGGDRAAAAGDAAARRSSRASLAGRGALIQTRDLDEACELANRIAPEHLELAVDDPQRWCRRSGTPARSSSAATQSEALGDYCAGPNHVLPTVAHRALLLAARRLRFPEALERDRRSATQARATLGPIAASSRAAKACRRTRARPSCGSK